MRRHSRQRGRHECTDDVLGRHRARGIRRPPVDQVHLAFALLPDGPSRTRHRRRRVRDSGLVATVSRPRVRSQVSRVGRFQRRDLDLAHARHRPPDAIGRVTVA